MRIDLLQSRAGRDLRIARSGSRQTAGPAMIGAMELPREDLLECRRRGDYYRYAWSLAGARAVDDAFVKMSAIRRLCSKLDLLGVDDRDDLPSLATISEERGSSPDARACVFELGHLRDVLEAMSSLGFGPPMGDLADGGGTFQVRLAAVALYDQTLLDGVATWVEDDPEFEATDDDPATKGVTSTWNKRATLRGCRLWELRKLITMEFPEISSIDKDPYAENASELRVWANKGGGKQSAIARVAQVAFWSPSRRAFAESDILRPALAARPEDVWVRDRLSDYWEVLRRGAIVMEKRGRTVAEMSKALRVHEDAVEDWLAAEKLGDS